MSEQAQIHILSVDDHPLLREGIAAIIRSQPDLVLVSQAASGSEAVHQYRQHQPDVTLMDLRLPDLSGIDAMIAIRTEFPEARIVMLTTFKGDVEIQRALEAGARGYLLKNMPPNELVQAIRQVHAGKKRVPPELAAQLADSRLHAKCLRLQTGSRLRCHNAADSDGISPGRFSVDACVFGRREIIIPPRIPRES